MISSYLFFAPFCGNYLSNQKRIRPFFAPDRRFGPVAAIDREIVAEAKDIFSDRSYQLIVIAARQIAAADSSAEKAVARKDHAFGFLSQHDMSRRVTRTMPDRES